jgi:magnesium-protoporphyrin O-methyltransferase
VALADTLPEADVVTLDRVVCCYPRFEPLLTGAARHARRSLAISYPREVWYVRAVMGFENLARRLCGSEFRVVVHPAGEMQELVRSQGFTLSRRRTTWTWSVDIYSRRA